MRKLNCILLLLINSNLFSQISIGFIDNFSGVQSVIYNPSAIADSFYKTDINIVSGNLNLGTDAVRFNYLEALGDVNFRGDGFRDFNDYIIERDFSKNSNYYTGNLILGPSFLMNLNRKTTIAFTSSVRAYSSFFNVSDVIYDRIDRDVYTNDPERLLTDNFDGIGGSGNIVSWAELGFTYASVLIHKKDKLLKYGLTLKFLRGIRAFSASIENFSATVNRATNLLDTNADIRGNFDISSSVEGTNYGQSLDIGFVYEKRNKTLPYYLKDREGLYYSKAPYQYKLAASITDIGFLSFNNTRTNSTNIDVNIPNELFDIDDYLVLTSNDTEKITYKLPTTVHLNVDYNIKPHWFVNANIDVFLLSNQNIRNIKSISNITVSARYESQHFSTFLPMSINRFGIFTSGIGFRTGYFFLGSSSLFTNLTDSSKEFNLFLGFKIPIYHKKVIYEYKNSFRHYTRE